MENDIVPELLEKIKEDFFKAAESNAQLERLLLLLQNGEATFLDAHEFSTILGKLIAKSLKDNISSAVLPEGKMHYNIAERILNDILGTNHNMVSSYSDRVQNVLNQKADIFLNSIKPKINQDRIDGMINRLSYEEKFDDVAWMLDEPVVNFSNNVVDKFIKANAEFQYKAGLSAKIIRTSTGNCCEWCDAIAGTYTYPKVPKDLYRRHKNCDCVVEYFPAKGSENFGKHQNSHTKKWVSDEI
nr:MAG TPA: hypothetical protein [Caudoviricetes sp.]